jgi:hypothetical protein
VSDFYGLVLTWLREWGNDTAAAVTAVTGDGSDWEGDTESGFYSRFSVSIQYVTASGKTATYEVHGEAMESLWRTVVARLTAEDCG